MCLPKPWIGLAIQQRAEMQYSATIWVTTVGVTSYTMTKRFENPNSR